ncbi:ATP-binding protein [Halanaeroarchaeum sp. HSR-CO]|uniref:ATP-binding protein n=1 Tax=Halanaeroarchaeum sp. HSR-CO TaxID=2866382 RepID=UPI0037BE75AA
MNRPSLRNGIDHADTEAPTIEWAVTCSSTEATIEVTDSNAPIPEMEREVLRGSQEIEPLLHGSGLSLWLVSHIVRSANGRLEFHERTPTGNRVLIHLPTNSPANFLTETAG